MMKKGGWESPEIRQYLLSKKAWRLKIGPDAPSKPVPAQYIVYAPSVVAAARIFRLKKIPGITDQSVVRYPEADRQ